MAALWIAFAPFVQSQAEYETSINIAARQLNVL